MSYTFRRPKKKSNGYTDVTTAVDFDESSPTSYYTKYTFWLLLFSICLMLIGGVVIWMKGLPVKIK